MEVPFSTDYPSILEKISRIDPVQYGKNRNYIDGAVTCLSPYISRGVISTQQILQHVLDQNYPFRQIESFVKELCWRDYFQQIGKVKDVDKEIGYPQFPVYNQGIPENIVAAKTEIEGIDQAIRQLYDTGYMHNHCRMYTASLICNIAKSHWYHPAQWMYYHLLDGDWASNACSWQWVAGTKNNKKYFANQENINTFTHTNQHHTFLDTSYELIETIEVPEHLLNSSRIELTTVLPNSTVAAIDQNLPTYIYNYYNLDPEWHKKEAGNRVLLLEPDFFKKYPVNKNCIDFMLALSKNIPGIMIYTGSFVSFTKLLGTKQIYYKEHPLNSGYEGTEEARDWITDKVTGFYPSFFNYWKRVEKELFS